MNYREGGFSLLEVLLAVLLLGTGLVFLIQTLNTGLVAGSYNESEIIAANLAQEMTEQLRNTTFASIASQTPASAVSGFPGFTREVLVTTPVTSLKQITVKVYWYARQTQTNLTMVSYVSDI
jgi:Tfp pilus assembly protein PilV